MLWGAVSLGAQGADVGGATLPATSSVRTFFVDGPPEKMDAPLTISHKKEFIFI